MRSYRDLWPRLRPCRVLYSADVGPDARAHPEGTLLVVEIFAVAAATWAVLMAVAPLLQVRRMLQRRSSVLRVACGAVSDDVALVIPNLVAFIVATATAVCALHLRGTSAKAH